MLSHLFYFHWIYFIRSSLCFHCVFVTRLPNSNSVSLLFQNIVKCYFSSLLLLFNSFPNSILIRSAAFRHSNNTKKKNKFMEFVNYLNDFLPKTKQKLNKEKQFNPLISLHRPQDVYIL